MAETPEELAARADVEALRQAQAERVAVRQRAQVDTAKLVVTFVLAVAATLVGTGLQVTPNEWPDKVASALLGVALVLALVTINKDRLLEPDFDAVSSEYTDVQRAASMRTLLVSTTKSNEIVVSSVKNWAYRCVLVSVLAGGVAVGALLIGGAS